MIGLVSPRSTAAIPAVLPAFPGWMALCLGLGTLVGLVLLLPPYPPVQDFLEWAYQGHLLARLLAGGALPGIGLVDHPVPNSTVQAVLGLLALAMPAAMAAQLVLLGLVSASVAVAIALGRRWRPDAPGALAAVLLVSVFLDAGFWNGYANYQAGLVLLGGWFLLPAARRGRAWPILGCGLVIFLTHAMVFAAFCAAVGAQAVLTRRVRAAALGLAPALALAAWYVLAEGEGGATAVHDQGGLGAFLAYKAYTFVKLGPYHNFVFAAGGDGVVRPMLYWAGAALNLGYAALLALALGWGGWRAWRRRRVAAAPVGAALLLLGLFAVLPDLLRNVVNPGERLLVPAVLLLLLALPVPAALLRVLGLGALALAANLLVLLAPGNDWDVPVHFTALEGGRAALFRHRPTAFACKWAEMGRLEAAGDAPRQPLAFRTSLLVGRTVEGCGK